MQTDEKKRRARCERGEKRPDGSGRHGDRHDFRVKNATAITTDRCPAAILRYPFSLRRWIFIRGVQFYSENVPSDSL